jgi:hypothetical protein
VPLIPTSHLPNLASATGSPAFRIQVVTKLK